MKGSSVAAVQCSLLLCYWTPKRRIRQYQVAPFSHSIFSGLQFFLSAGSAVAKENSIVLPPSHCTVSGSETTLNSKIKVLTAFRSPLLHTIAGSVNQISGDDLCHQINDFIDENKISKLIIFLLHLQTHGTFYEGIFYAIDAGDANLSFQSI